MVLAQLTFYFLRDVLINNLYFFFQAEDGIRDYKVTGVQTCALPISRSFDHFFTAAILGPVEGKNYVAYYNTVARINNMVDVPSLAAADVLYPKNVEALETEGHQKVKHYFEEVAGSIIAFIFPVSLFVFLFPKFIIYIIAGPDYYPAIAILQLTILFGMVRPLSYQFGSTLDAVGKPDINFIANTLLMLFNFFLTYLFLTLFGGMGAAYAI